MGGLSNPGCLGVGLIQSGPQIDPDTRLLRNQSFICPIWGANSVEILRSRFVETHFERSLQLTVRVPPGQAKAYE
jgi:hypothetical protein